MSENTAGSHDTPKHLWVVGIFALLWSAMGAWSYLMAGTGNEAYMSSFTPEQVDYYANTPSWQIGVGTIAVLGGMLGAVLLLLRKRWATPVFLVSFVAMIGTQIYSYLLSNWYEVGGGMSAVAFSAAIFVFSLAFYLYARMMEQRDVLN